MVEDVTAGRRGGRVYKWRGEHEVRNIALVLWSPAVIDLNNDKYLVSSRYRDSLKQNLGT